MVSISSIQSFVKSSGVKSILQTKPQIFKGINPAELKLAKPLKQDTVQLSQHIGKHKIPRYIYHMTSSKNYQEMLESGSILPSGSRMPDGVYMLELDSFSKYWKSGFRNDLCDMILRSGSQDVVMLKIPTNKLDVSKLRIRTQKQVENDAFLYKAGEEWFNISKLPEDRLNLVNELIKKYGKKEGMKKYVDIMPEYMDPITKGMDAKLTPLYKQKKADIEFVYNAEIPISQVEKIGRFDGGNYNCDAREKNICKTIFESIFKNKSEERFLRGWRD